MKRLLCSSVIAGLFAAGAALAAELPSGVDTAFHDASVRPQDDFFHFSQGKWLKDVDIPADRASWGAFNVAAENVEQQIRSIIEQAGAEHRKIGDFYASYLDEGKRNSLGLSPLKAELARIAAIKNKAAIAAQIAHNSKIGVGSPFRLSVEQDSKNSSVYVLSLAQSGLGMPNRDYYLAKDDAKLADTRAKYTQHVEAMLSLAGHTAAAKEAASVVALETAIAQAQWTAVENRDPVKLYNKLSLAELKTLAPDLDWQKLLKDKGIATKLSSLVVSQPSFVAGVSKLVKETPVEVWQAYFSFRLLSTYAPYLSQAFVDESFAFRSKVLTGTQVNLPLQKRAIGEVNRSLGQEVGKAYVAKYFPPERKQQVETMVKNFLAAFKEGIETLDWMSPETKKQAQIKLAKISVKVGYPDQWRDYSKLRIAKDDLVGNVLRSREFAEAYEMSKLGKPVDRKEWGMTPQTVNASYSPEMNDITFPAARLQYPLYDTNAEPAINYGAVGISIGHEISHAFDDEGSQFDGDGNLRNWWTKEDSEKFAARGKILVAQYGSYSPLPGYNINGALTLGENIADNAGAIMASRAYKISQGGKPGPVIDGFTAEQRLFFGVAQARRGKARDPALISQIKSDPHSPAEFRVNGSMRNHPGFYDAFGVKPGDKMYLAPEERVIFW